MLIRFLLGLVLIALLAAAYFWIALTWSYSSGERAGWVQKFSHKGWLCKTWEGELALVSVPGTQQEKFLFTVRDEAAAATVAQAMGKRVALHYEEKVGLPTTCFGETRHFVTRVMLAESMPLAPGVSVPQPGAAAPIAVPAAPAAPAVVAAPAASVVPVAPAAPAVIVPAVPAAPVVALPASPASR